MRDFIIRFPNWEQWGVKPGNRKFIDPADISAEWFSSSSEVAQLALQMSGSDIIRTGKDPVWTAYVDGSASITRQINFTLHILQNSYLSGQRSDNSEMLLDFISWVDLMNVTRDIPILGDEPHDERIWATNGCFTVEWEGKTSASVYTVQLHHLYSTFYESKEF